MPAAWLLAAPPPRTAIWGHGAATGAVQFKTPVPWVVRHGPARARSAGDGWEGFWDEEDKGGGWRRQHDGGPRRGAAGAACEDGAPTRCRCVRRARRRAGRRAGGPAPRPVLRAFARFDASSPMRIWTACYVRMNGAAFAALPVRHPRAPACSVRRGAAPPRRLERFQRARHDTLLLRATQLRTLSDSSKERQGRLQVLRRD